MMMSRKLWAIFLVICMVVTFAACGVKSSDDDGDSSSKKTSKGEKDLYQNSLRMTMVTRIPAPVIGRPWYR